MARFPKHLKFNLKAREKLLKGINTTCDAVASTLGPRASNVAINQGQGAPLIIHDGVTVSNFIDLPDPFEDMGAQLVKEGCGKTVDRAGDGTTLTAVLIKAIVNEGDKLVRAGFNAQAVKRELELEISKVNKNLKELSKGISSKDEVEQVATISSASETLGKMIAEAHEKVGKEGIITADIGRGFETTIEYKQGMEIDRGYLSSYFVTNNEKVEAEIENPYILVTDKRFGHASELLPFIENFMKWETENKNLVIIASEVVEESLALLVVNHLDTRSTIRCIAINAPAFGGRRTDELEDIAILIGGQVILHESGRKIESVILEELGRADKVVSDRDKTIIFGGRGKKEAIQQRISDLREQIKTGNTTFDEQIKEQRMAKLAGGIAVINVGAATETEARDIKERVIDAIAATKAAVEEGIVAGGEIAFLHLARKTKNPILQKAFKEPFKTLLANAGIEYADAVRKLTGKTYPWGIDVMDGHRKDMLKAGIIDPLKVVRLAIENAVSVSVMALTTNVLISEVPDDKKE